VNVCKHFVRSLNLALKKFKRTKNKKEFMNSLSTALMKYRYKQENLIMRKSLQQTYGLIDKGNVLLSSEIIEEELTLPKYLKIAIEDAEEAVLEAKTKLTQCKQVAANSVTTKTKTKQNLRFVSKK